MPGWVDWDLVEEGAAVPRRLGQNAGDVLLQLSLMGGYRFGGPPDLLAATGGADRRQHLRRLGGDAEVDGRAVRARSTPALRTRLAGHRARPGDARAGRRVVHRPGRWSSAPRPRPSDTPRWDTARWGLPINQADQASTLGLFDGILILGCRALGVRIPPSDSRALMHLWK